MLPALGGVIQHNMTKHKIITVIGARPQFIKAAALSRAFAQHNDLEEIIVHTGQHHDADMSDIFFQELEIPKPRYKLNINGLSHGAMTGRMLEQIDEILLKEKPSAVLVYGDTNSTLAGALSATKLHIPVYHVEAGLRSFNRKMPEEINRILTDHVSTLLFCPTLSAVQQLKKEGIEKNVFHVGDVMYDATLHAKSRIAENMQLEEKFSFIKNKYALLTVHRAESTHSPQAFKEIFDYVHQFSESENLKIVFPVHPRSKKLMEGLSESVKKNLICISPTSYFETQFLIQNAVYVITDSGGLQKEAYFHQVPCITLRSETEWVETIEAGWNRLWRSEKYEGPQKEISDYGQGDAAHKIVQEIIHDLKIS